MQVRDGMNRDVVTVGPDHTLREAARRMTGAEVGAAVVIDPDGMGPSILTERDLLYSSGRDEDPDAEHVRDHMTQRLTYAPADSSLERAAEEMVRHPSATWSCSTDRRSSGSCRCATSSAGGRSVRRAPPGMSTSSAAATTGRPDSAESPGARQLSQTQ